MQTVQGFSTSIERLYTDMVIQESKNKRQILQWISKLKLVESCSIYFVVANEVVARSWFFGQFFFLGCLISKY